MIKRVSIFLYGIACYLLGLASLLYAVGFIGGFGVPRSLDSPAAGPLVQSVVIDLALLALFALQHSGMARPAFKRWLTRAVAPEIERSTFLLATSIALTVLFVLWQPLGGVVWEVSEPVGRTALYVSFAFGWLLVLVSTFLINHFDLFGLRQVWLALTGKRYAPVPFRTPGLYRLVRHPLYVGFFFAIWSTPRMTSAHLLFALIITAYILIAIRWEERDLVDALGEDYLKYRKRVPMIIPGLASGRQPANENVHGSIQVAGHQVGRK